MKYFNATGLSLKERPRIAAVSWTVDCQALPGRKLRLEILCVLCSEACQVPRTVRPILLKAWFGVFGFQIAGPPVVFDQDVLSIDASTNAVEVISTMASSRRVLELSRAPKKKKGQGEFDETQCCSAKGAHPFLFLSHSLSLFLLLLSTVTTFPNIWMEMPSHKTGIGSLVTEPMWKFKSCLLI